MSDQNLITKPDETDVNRRSFMQIMGASAALASMGGCVLRRPKEHIVPYGTLPEDVVLGRPLNFASSFNLCGDVQGLLVKSFEGRPTKVEGLPGHPNNNGKSNSWAQAFVLELYDPDRSFHPLKDGVESDWDSFDKEWQALDKSKVAFLLADDNSPSLNASAKALKDLWPASKWFKHRPINDANVRDGLKLAYGSSSSDLAVKADYGKAHVIVALDCDFLSTEPGHIKATAQFASHREIEAPKEKMNRLYAVESRFTVTGGKADHRIAMKSSEVLGFLGALINQLSANDSELKTLETSGLTGREKDAKKIAVLAKDLLANKGQSLLVAGLNQPPLVHALVAAVNKSLGNVGRTVSYVNDVPSFDCDSIQSLVEAMNNGSVDTLVLVDSNPVYNAPAELKFLEALKKVTNSIHLGLHRDETAQHCGWHLNIAHPLESWGDWSAPDGQVSLQQPLISPLSEVVKGSKKIGKNGPAFSPIAFLSLLSGKKVKKNKEDKVALPISDHDIVKKQSGLSETAWRKAVHDGLLPTKAPDKPKLSVFRHRNIAGELKKLPKAAEGLEVVFCVDAKVHDGRFSNNGWLQELPDPMSKIAWDNPVYMSKKTAKDKEVAEGDLIKIELNGLEAIGAVHVMPGHATGSITLTLGYGRTFDKDKGGNKGVVGGGVGHDFYPLISSDDSAFTEGATLTVVGKYEFANTQTYIVQDGRNLVKQYSQKMFEADPTLATRDIQTDIPENMQEHYDGMKLTTKSLSTDLKYDGGYQWGMNIDLTRCTGCAACTIACQSENNIPIVGKKEVMNGREMHWIRMDRYFTYEGDDSLQEIDGTSYLEDKENPSADLDDSEVGIATMPVACQHCETAPCEEVCPVAATSHSEEGLNDMTYNRCVGTRYCSNNCPYKVRRFNYFHYTQKGPWASPKTIWGADATWGNDVTFGYGELDKLDKMQANPHVTVRFRGVMEKCTYCVQRVNESRVDAKGSGKVMSEANGNLPVPACGQACPADAITFGDITDDKSKLVHKRNLDHSYKLLEALNTKPRTTFLAAIRNPNPDWPMSGILR